LGWTHTELLTVATAMTTDHSRPQEGGQQRQQEQQRPQQPQQPTQPPAQQGSPTKK
jgi:hypothetical protein